MVARKLNVLVYTGNLIQSQSITVLNSTFASSNRTLQGLARPRSR